MNNNHILDKDSIQKEARRFAQANTYFLDNSYLNQFQKLEVELWFQFPTTASFTIFCVCLVYHSFYPLQLKTIIIIPSLIDLFAGMLNWYSYFRRLNSGFFLTIGHNFSQWIIVFATISVLFYHEHYLWTAIVLAGKFGLLSLFSPSIYIYPWLAKRYNMHPKYAFFRKYHNKKFPFEDDHQVDDIEEDFDTKVINGKQIRELARVQYQKFSNLGSGLTTTEKCKILLMDRYSKGTEFHDLANSNKDFLTDLQSLLFTIINMEFPNGRDQDSLSLQYYEALKELCNLEHQESKNEMKNLREIMEKASANGLDEVDGLLISMRSGLLHKQDNFHTILSQLEW